MSPIFSASASPQPHRPAIFSHGILLFLMSSIGIAAVAAFGVRRDAAPSSSAPSFPSSRRKHHWRIGIGPQRNKIAVGIHFRYESHCDRVGRTQRRNLFQFSGGGLRASSVGGDDDGEDPRSSQQHPLIESWLTDHLPIAPPSDLQDYAACLFDSGFASLDKLNSITGEYDLVFMKKGHRRALLKNIQGGNVSGGDGNDTTSIGGKPPVVDAAADPAKNTENIENSGRKASGEECLVGEECWDITRDAVFSKRLSKSLTTTFPSKNSETTENECVGEECWDITRAAIFSERVSRSLATTLPPTNGGKNAVRGGDDGGYNGMNQNLFHDDNRGRMLFRALTNARQSAAKGRSLGNKPDDSDILLATPSDSKKKEHAESSLESSTNVDETMFEKKEVGPEAYYDITSVFPDRQGGTQPSAFEEEQKSEMNNRKRASALYQKFQRSSSALPSSSHFEESRAGGEKADEVYYDITQSSFPERQSSFKEREKTEMNNRRPRSSNMPKWTGTGKKMLTNATPSITTDGKSAIGDQRPSSGMPKKTSAKKMFANATPSIKADEDASFLDLKMVFQDNRLSSLVNTDPKRRGAMKPGSFEEGGKRHDDSFRVGVDITKQFPEDRPSLSVNTGTKKARTTSGSYKESKDRSDNSKRNEDDNYVDIQLFPEDRKSFVMRVNSGSNQTGIKRRRAIAMGTCKEESYRDIAHNFSIDQASLHGHSSSKKVVKPPPTAEEECDDDDICLDMHNFSSDLDPPSPKTTMSSNAVWRADSSAVKHAKYLDTPDTPRAFARNLNMVPSSRVRATEADKYLDTNSFSFDRVPQQSYSSTSASKKTASQDRRVTEADKYLDTHQFSWNLSPSTGGSSAANAKTPSIKKDEQQFLDMPRPFQSRSDVDMVSSNLSGSKFKRSSDIPPELKNVKDYYDITTAPMPSIDVMADTKISRKAEAATERKKRSGGGGGEFFDITRIPMTKLERTSSAVKDANTASKARRKEGGTLMDDNTSSSGLSNNDDNASSDSGEESSSYEEVMSWLLTHLPKLQEEDAIAYFNSLLDDGFDSERMLGEMLETDLHFMKRGHRRALLRNISGANEATASKLDDDELHQDSPETEILAADGETKSPKTLDDAIDRIVEQNRLVEERLAARLAAEAAEIAVAAKEQERVGAAEDDEFEDITHSRFVQGPSISSSASRSTNRKRIAIDNDGTNMDDINDEEVYDITRDAFPVRPSLDSAPGHYETLSSRERSKRKAKASSTSLPLRGAAGGAAAAPRAEMYQYYVKVKGLAASHAQNLKYYCTTWTDDAKSHELKFSCIFTCPLTGERFACGNWSTNGGESGVEKARIFWYKNKKQAMNAAAAKALDCFSLRECHGTENAALAPQRCRDAPYFPGEDAPVLPILPAGIDLPKILIPLEDSLSEQEK